MSRILIGNVRDKLVNNLLATKAGTGALDAAQGKVLKDLVESVLGQQADTYSKKTYAVGDYCIYGNALYKCNTAISSAEEWTAGHWTKTTIANELKSIVGSVATVNNAITELNGKTPCRKNHHNSGLDQRDGCDQCHLFSDGYIKLCYRMLGERHGQ